MGVIWKINTYQRTFLIVAGSLLALLVLIAIADTSGGQHLQSSPHAIAKGAVVLADYQVDSANLAALTKDIFTTYETDHGGTGNSNGKKDSRKLKQKKQKGQKGQKKKKSTHTPTTDIPGMVPTDDDGTGVVTTNDDGSQKNGFPCSEPSCCSVDEHVFCSVN